jgi:tetratricopeptide (TPR) repeat protein
MAQLQEQVVNISKQTTSVFGRNLQTKIYRALSQIFVQQHNYETLEKLVQETYQRFTEQQWFDKENHDLKLQMLTYYANALYKNGKHKESLSYTEKLGKEIEQFNKLHYDRYLFFFYNLQIVNNSVLNPSAALKALDDFQNEIHRKKNYYYDTFIYLNRAGLLYDIGRFKDALKSLVKLYLSDSYIKGDKTFRFKVEVTEMIITYEAADYDTLLYRIEQIKKDYKTLRNDKNYQRDFGLIELIEKMADSHDIKRDAAIQKQIKTLLKLKTDPAGEDSELINYRGWLSRKLVS